MFQYNKKPVCYNKKDVMDDSLVDNSGITCLAEAESWDDQQLEDRLQELLHLATEVLEDSEAHPEDKHEAMRWLADKLLPLIPIYELDETGYCPLLTAVQDCLEQVQKQCLL